MARADLLVNLIQYGLAHDDKNFRSTAEAICAEERAKQHEILADKIENDLSTIRPSDNDKNSALQVSSPDTSLFESVYPQKKISDLVLSTENLEVISDFIEEHKRAELLKSYGIEPRNKMVLVGPPGNGKTSLAEAIATSLMLPLFVVRYDTIIGSFLGETAARLNQLFQYVKTRSCVLFFDEFDTIGKERGDEHDTGEIKRVVSSLLLQIDALPSYVIAIAATNHASLLDKAVWRRFQVKMELNQPSRTDFEAWIKMFETRTSFKLEVSSEWLSAAFFEMGFSFSDAEEFCDAIYRKYVLTLPNSHVSVLVKNAVKRAMKNHKISLVNGGSGIHE